MVRGLTTYVSERSAEFLKDYELPHNSFLVIDGDSVAVDIYLQLKTMNTCFGGDYDIYANAVRQFFKDLSDCEITAYVLFDGATQPGKVETAIRRLRERVQKTTQINCSTNNLKFYPLFLTEVFKGIVKELNIAMVMCDFDCDKEVANIAHQLDSPLLSYDSDYFIYDVKYIPFFLNENRQNLNVRKIVRNKGTSQEHTVKYLRCKIFDRETFLRRTHLTNVKLPILTVYLGNDFIDRVKDVPNFCRYLNLCRGNFVGNIINWLAGESIIEAINIMVNYYGNLSKKGEVTTAFKKTIDEYTCTKSQCLEYLQATSVSEVKLDNSIYLKNISETFIDKYRRGCYHHYFLDILLFHKYYPRPQVENNNKPSSHTLSFPLISVIHKILTDDSTEKLIFYGRTGLDLSEQVIEKSETEVPSYDQIQEMTNQNKLIYFLEILNIENKFKDFLDLFPKSWHIFLITLKYISMRKKIELSLIYNLVLSKIILSHVDKKVGFVRSWDDFDKCVLKYESDEAAKKNKSTEFIDVTEALEEINTKDSLITVEKLLSHFEISQEMKYNDDLFNRHLIHSMSEFQSCLLHIDFLNDIFCMPFEKCQIWELYNGTLIYNLLIQNDPNFICNTLETAPTVLRCFEFIVSQLETHMA